MGLTNTVTQIGKESDLMILSLDLIGSLSLSSLFALSAQHENKQTSIDI